MSLKGDKYETAEEVRSRLCDTIVMYDGKPVYIHDVRLPEGPEEKDDIARVLFYELPWGGLNRKSVRKYLSSRKFDLTPFKMGYMNYKDTCIYVTRKPVRQYKQGLSQATTVFSDVSGAKYGGINFGMMAGDQSFVDMIEGKYPSFKEAGELLNSEECTAVAINHSYAMMLDADLDALIVWNKGVKCGLALKGDKGIRLPAKFHFLRQELEEVRIPFA